MTNVGPASNKARTLAFRDELVLFLRENGFDEVSRRPELATSKLSDRLRNDPGDILGLPWALAVRRQHQIDLSESVLMAAGKALTAGTRLYATIHHRRDAGIDQSYVTMPLSVFMRVLRFTPGAESSESQ